MGTTAAGRRAPHALRSRVANSNQRAVGILALLALVGAAAGVLFLTREGPDDRSQIRQAIHQVAQGAEHADLAEALEPISQAYRDDDGLSRDNLKGWLFVEFQRRGPVHALLGPIEVTLEEGGQQALATFNAALGEGGAGVVGELLPQSGDVFTFDVTLQREGEAWRITSHQRFTLEGDRVRLPVD